MPTRSLCVVCSCAGCPRGPGLKCPPGSASVNFRPPEGGAGTAWRSRGRPRLASGCGLPARDLTSAPRLDGPPRTSLGQSVACAPWPSGLPSCRAPWAGPAVAALRGFKLTRSASAAWPVRTATRCHRRAAWVCGSASLFGALGVRLETGAGARAALAWARGGRRSRGPGPGPARGWWQESLPGLAVVAAWLWPGCRLGQVAAGP